MPRSPKRGQTVPVAAWWYESVRRELAGRSLTWLAAEVNDIVANISRCLTGEVPTLHLVIRISDLLKVPRPIYLPQTEMEALAIHATLNLRAVDDAKRSIENALPGATTHEPPGNFRRPETPRRKRT